MYVSILISFSTTDRPKAARNPRPDQRCRLGARRRGRLRPTGKGQHSLRVNTARRMNDYEHERAQHTGHSDRGAAIVHGEQTTRYPAAATSDGRLWRPMPDPAYVQNWFCAFFPNPSPSSSYSSKRERAAVSRLRKPKTKSRRPWNTLCNLFFSGRRSCFPILHVRTGYTTAVAAAAGRSRRSRRSRLAGRLGGRRGRRGWIRTGCFG